VDYFGIFLGLFLPAINFSNSTDFVMSRAACSMRSVAVSRNFSASRRSCSEVGLSGMTPSCHKIGSSPIGRPNVRLLVFPPSAASARPPFQNESSPRTEFFLDPFSAKSDTVVTMWSVGFQAKAFRTINVQWIGQWGVISLCSTSSNQ